MENIRTADAGYRKRSIAVIINMFRLKSENCLSVLEIVKKESKRMVPIHIACYHHDSLYLFYMRGRGVFSGFKRNILLQITIIRLERSTLQATGWWALTKNTRCCTILYEGGVGWPMH